jgi:hypothetical protein
VDGVQDRSNWTLEQQLAHERELRQKREAWEKRRRFDKEQAEREKKQAGLEVALKARARVWEDHTGSPATPDQIRTWTEEYVTMRQVEGEMENEARRAEAEAEHYNF